MNRFLSAVRARLGLGRPSPAMTVAILALVVAIGGTASAALLVTSKTIKNGTIRGRDVHKRTLPASKLTSAALASLKGAPGDPGADGADGSDGASGTNGTNGAAGTPGSAVGYATITGAGDVVEAFASNVADANVTKVGNFICFNGLGFTPKLVVANIDSNFGVGSSVQTNAGSNGGSAVCPGAEQASAVQVNSAGASQAPVVMHVALY